MEIVIFIVIGSIVVYSFWRYRRKVKEGCCDVESTSVKQIHKALEKPASDYRFHVELVIEGMHCEQCLKKTLNALNQLDGCVAFAGNRFAAVELVSDQDMTSPEIIKAIQAAGYMLKTLTVITN